MNNSSLGNFLQYAALFFKLLMPFSVLRWILGITAILWFFSVMMQGATEWDFLLAIAVAVTALIIFLFLLLIPNQVMALASSRPVSLLGDSRRLLLSFIFALVAVVSWVLYWLIAFKEEPNEGLSLILVISLIVSLLLQSSIFICSRWPNTQGFIFALSGVWVKIGIGLLAQNPLLLLLGWFMSWVIFSRWWLRWQPKRYQPNVLVAVINNSQQAAIARNAGFLFQVAKAESWLDSRFLGASDGWRSRSQPLMFACIIFLIAPIPMSLLMGSDQFQRLIYSSLVLMVMFFAASVAQGIAGNFACNLRHIWLCSPGDRQSIFNIAWKLYVRETGICSLVCIGLGVVVEHIWGQWRGIEIWLCAAVTLLLMNAVSFYLAWWVYLRSQGSLLWCNWIGGLAVMLLMMLFMATGLQFPLPFDWQGISIALVWLLLLVLIGLLHKPVRLGFARVNFTRAV
ncbi:MAG TPA: hypothetical protein VLF09_11520 [Cellvibrio sp.]|nr:hypothetical protein [Cellvibrio sp.]